MDAGQRGHMETTDDRRRIAAREGLLDAVEALGPHGDAVILVGAQAVYMSILRLKTPASRSPPSPMTRTSCLTPPCWGTPRG